MENYDLGEQPFKRMVLSSLPILSELLPDGIEKPWWKRVLAKLKIWGWNIPIHNGVYNSSNLFRMLFDPQKRVGDLSTAIAITKYIPTIDASVISYNKPLEQIAHKDGVPVLRPDTMPHDNYRYDPNALMWVLASQSSAIPFQFYNVPLLLPLDDHMQKECRDSCSWYNFDGQVTDEDRRAWQITGRGLLGMHGGNAIGFGVTDGAVTTNTGAAAATYDRNTIIISIYPAKAADPIKFDSSWRWAQYKFFVGPIYQTVKSGMFLLTDSWADKQQLIENRWMKIDNDFYLPTVMAIDTKANRKALKDKNGREYPDWTEFNKYDYQTTHDIFEESYSDAVRKLLGDASRGIEPLFSDEDIIRMGNEKVSICVSGGGAAAVDEVAYVAAVLDIIHSRRDMSQISSVDDMGIINLLTGTSAGALTALYFANLHDSYCTIDDD